MATYLPRASFRMRSGLKCDASSGSRRYCCMPGSIRMHVKILGEPPLVEHTTGAETNLCIFASGILDSSIRALRLPPSTTLRQVHLLPLIAGNRRRFIGRQLDEAGTDHTEMRHNSLSPDDNVRTKTVPEVSAMPRRSSACTGERIARQPSCTLLFYASQPVASAQAHASHAAIPPLGLDERRGQTRYPMQVRKDRMPVQEGRNQAKDRRTGATRRRCCRGP